MSVSSKKKIRGYKTVMFDGKGLWSKVKDNNELDISLMGLKEVPMGEMQPFAHRLTRLDLSNNKLSELTLDFASNLRQLTHLDLSKNVIVSLPENIGLLASLAHMDLYRNQIQRLPLSMGDMIKLRWLDLKDNPLVPTLEKVCGACSNEVECRSAAQNVVIFMKQLGQQINAMGESEAEDVNNSVLTAASLSKVSQGKIRGPSKAVSAPIREVLSPPRDNGCSDSETDKGSGEEEIILDGVYLSTKSGSDIVRDSRLSNHFAGRRGNSQQRDPSTMSLVDETGVISSGNSKTGKKSKKKSVNPRSCIVGKNSETVAWKGEAVKKAKHYYKLSKPALNFLIRALIYMTCMYISGFMLLAIAYDDNYIRYFLEDCIKCPSLIPYVLPMHGIFQVVLQFGSSTHYLPMGRLTEEGPVQDYLGKFFDFITSFTSA